MTIRAKLLIAFASIALIAVGGMAFAGKTIFEERAIEHAGETFEEARGQVQKMLRLRYEAFQAVSDLSYVLPVMRQVTAGATDESDFGLGDEKSDADNLKTLHANLVDANWGWAAKGAKGFFAVADYKGRLLFASENKTAWGGDTRALAAVESAFDPKGGYLGSMVVASDDPALLASGMVSKTTTKGLYVIFARATVLGGEARAVFVQAWEARNLVSDLGISDRAARLALLAEGGALLGDVDGELLAIARSLGEGERRQVVGGGARWLVQRVHLKDIGGDRKIADLVLAYNLDQRLETLLAGVGLLVGVAAGMLLFALLVSVLVSSRMSRPIQELSAAANRVARGDLDVQVQVGTRDEIGLLGEAFNRMTDGLKERDRIKRTFKRYVAPDVVEYLLDNPEATQPGGERRRLTMLFSDLAGFTTISEDREPEEVVRLLNRYLGMVSERLVERGGTLDKYMGDGVMAFFGAPIPRSDDAVGACLSALDHQAVVAELNRDLAGTGLPELQVRVGLHKGDVIVGNIGGEQSQDYTVIGDAVNLAARLEPVNKVYGTRVIASEDVWNEAHERFEGRELDSVRVKGKSRAVRIFEILGETGWGAENPAKKACVDAFADGLIRYRAQDFTGALASFDAALAACADDPPSLVFKARCEQAIAHPPQGEWDGVWTLTSK